MTKAITVLLAGIFCTFLYAQNLGRQWQMIPALGDARVGRLTVTNDLNEIRFAVGLPEGSYDGLTVTTWLRLDRYNNDILTTFAEWCPENIQWSNPDLLAGAGGFVAGGFGGSAIDLDAAGGVVAFSDMGFVCWDDVPVVVSNKSPHGVYTIAGECTDTITVSVGGNEVNIQAGEFTRNVNAGVSDTLIISGSGLVNLGISRTPCVQMYREIDGITESDTTMFIPESLVTNDFAFCVWRIKCEDGHQIYRSDLGRIHAFDALSIVTTNGVCEALHSGGLYYFGLVGPKLNTTNTYDAVVFDERLFLRYLSDAELERIHINGVQELYRREQVSDD